MGVGKREENFKRYIERHFGIELPAGIVLLYRRGVRVASPALQNCDIHGEPGYAACDFGFNPTHAFIQNFGHLAKRNTVQMSEEMARAYATGKVLRIDLGEKRKHIIVRYKGHVLGSGYYNGKKTLLNKLPKKGCREIINRL